MINKPTAPTLADYVRGDKRIIEQKWQLVDEYKRKVFDALAKDFGTEDSYELVIRLAEKYHEPFKQNETQGRKLKWTPEIETMLAVLVELRLEDDVPPSVDDEIDWLLSLKALETFANKGNKKIVDGHESFKNARKKGIKNPQFQYEMDSYRENPEAWMAKFIEKLK